MRKITKLLAIPLFSMALSSCGTGVKYPISSYCAKTINVGSKNAYRILQLTDIHLGNKDNQDEQFDFLNAVISSSNMDMIVVTGDLFTFADKVTAYRLFDFLDSYNVPWTVTFGNHDEQCYFSVDWLTSTLNNYGKNCCFIDHQDDDIHGNANFYINLVDSSNKVKQQVIIFDSNRYNFGNNFGYDTIKEDQIEWYKNVVSETKNNNGGEVVPSLAFFHIPFPEFLDAYDKATKQEPGAEFVNVERSEKNEGVSAPKINTGLYNVMLELGSTKGVFVGHDHVNSYCVNYNGIYLGYGINSTNRIYSKENLIGGQVIAMDFDSGQITIDRYFHTYEEVR